MKHEQYVQNTIYSETKTFLLYSVHTTENVTQFVLLMEGLKLQACIHSCPN